MERPEVVNGVTHRINTGCGKMYVTIGYVGGEPIEVFVRLGKAGGCASSQTEALGRMVSLALRNKIKMSEIVKELQAISCHQPCWTPKGGKVLSCADALAIVFRESNEEEVQKDTLTFSESCPDCGSTVAYIEGCNQCSSQCGWSKC